jgi:hypothetical protein
MDAVRTRRGHAKRDYYAEALAKVLDLGEPDNATHERIFELLDDLRIPHVDLLERIRADIDKNPGTAGQRQRLGVSLDMPSDVDRGELRRIATDLVSFGLLKDWREPEPESRFRQVQRIKPVRRDPIQSWGGGSHVRLDVSLTRFGDAFTRFVGMGKNGGSNDTPE